ncbi:MAG: DUF5685 family protein [Oscillospiraceae bacterium]|nr:DUF5685 family protein [Oscillospiraceae bacterium]
MFGYFNPRNSISYLKIRNKYRKYYCSCCKALQYNYGNLAKTLLSYDVTVFAFFMNTDVSCAKNANIPCNFIGHCGSFENVKENNQWKAIGALNLLLVWQKLKDDIYDENLLYAKIGLRIYRKSIIRAINDFPNMAKEIEQGYERIVALEKENADVSTIAMAFSDMMYAALSSALCISEQQKLFFNAISSWIYIIDALDDYDKDLKKKRFNPLICQNMSFEDYIHFNSDNIVTVINDITQNCLNYTDSDFDYKSAKVILSEFIPEVTQIILKGMSLSLVRLKAMLTWFSPLSLKRKK